MLALLLIVLIVLCACLIAGVFMIVDKLTEIADMVRDDAFVRGETDAEDDFDAIWIGKDPTMLAASNLITPYVRASAALERKFDKLRAEFDKHIAHRIGLRAKRENSDV